MMINYCLKMILKHIHNALIIFLFTIFLFSCSKSDQDFVENCADIKTTPYWQSRVMEFSMEIGTWKARLKAAKDKYEKSAIKGMIEMKENYRDVYRNAAKKSLNEKLYEFPSFEKNFEKCQKLFFFNPEAFERLYK